MVAGWAWMKSVAGLGVVDGVVAGSFLGLPPWAYTLLAVDLLQWIWVLLVMDLGLLALGFFFFGWVLLIHDLLQTPLTLCLFLFYFYTLIYFYHFCPKKKMQDILLDWLINRVSKTQFLG